MRKILAMVLTLSLILTVFVGIEDVNATTTEVPYDIYSNDGGFVITNAMLDMTYDQIAWPMTHNSFALKGTFSNLAANQDLTITQQLEHGIRSIEFDIDCAMNVSHGGQTANLNRRLTEIKNYAAAHPKTIITVRVNDVVSVLGNMFSRMNGRLEDTGLDDYIYNWDASKGKSDSNKFTFPNPWPTLETIIDSGKNVIFISSSDNHDVIDSAAFRGLNHSHVTSPCYSHLYAGTELEHCSEVQQVWSPNNNDRQKNRATSGVLANRNDRLFHLEVTCDNGYTAGSPFFATINNDGRRLYNLAKHWDDNLLPNNRLTNFISIDFYMSRDLPGSLNNRKQPISIIDACNRLNVERSGYSYQTLPDAKNFEPHENELGYINVLENTTAETEANSMSDLWSSGYKYLTASPDYGYVQSSDFKSLAGFHRLPEYALDDDFFTRWSNPSHNGTHSMVMDLGSSKAFSEIAIDWYNTAKRPGYEIYGSNDSSFVSDSTLMSHSTCTSDTGWTLITSSAYESGSSQAWDVSTFNEVNYRYIKIKITDSRHEAFPSIFEIRVMAQKYFKLRNRWNNHYLVQSGDELTYSNTVTDHAYWTAEKVAGTNFVRFKNKATGDYINTENFVDSPTDTHAQVTDIRDTAQSSKWIVEALRYPNEDTEYRLRSAWTTHVDEVYLNIEDLDGKVQATQTEGFWHSSCWFIEY